MKEFTIHNSCVRVFKNGLVKIYAATQSEANAIWEYIQKEGLIMEND